MNRAIEPDIRPVREDEHDELIRFWMKHFSCSYECFVRVFAQDWYRDSHCLIIRDGQGVAASVHAERRVYEWRGRQVVCGAVGEVATAQRRRHQGLATAVLRESLRHMEADGVAFSLLMTGVPELYARLGWEHITLPHVRLSNVRPDPQHRCDERPVLPVPEELGLVCEQSPHRPLHFPRPARYLSTYASWSWQNERSNARVLLLPAARGFAVVSEQSDGSVWVDEIRTHEPSAEEALIRACAAWGANRGRSALHLHFLPQFTDRGSLCAMGELADTARTDFMIRRISMPEDDYRALNASLETGESVLWDVDEF